MTADKPESGLVTSPEITDKTGDRALINTLSPTDFQARPTDARSAQSQNAALEQKQVLPPTRINESQQEVSVLSDPKAGAQEKLKAVEALARSGVNSVVLTDASGHQHTCRVELEHHGSKNLVHLYAEDSNGREHVLLRGVSNGDGSYSQETNARGASVGFNGDWWSRHGGALASDGGQNELAPQQRVAYETNADINDPLRRDFFGAQTDQHQYGNLNQDFDTLASQARRDGKHMERLPDGALYIQAGMDIDSDGAPDARRIDPTGSRDTSLHYQNGAPVNSHEVPYFVLPLSRYQQYGVKQGDIAAVRYNGKVEFAVFADAGPHNKLGEGSMALARSLGINESPTRGGVRQGVEYIVFPHSGDHTPGSPDLNRWKGAQLLKAHADYLARANGYPTEA